ncbi:hypothetical protein AB1286_23970 [Trinickia sp. NRRL B-1857]|uniref:hypothetical protein n=1 Tax=Trinickia sp. NRRL B-1857 TaxID=3162879 RepID=UPI003D2CEEF3
MTDKGTMFLLVTVLVLLTCLLIFAMKYFSVVRRAQLSHASDDAYRALAERAVKGQEEMMLVVTGLRATIEHVEKRLASVEKVLKEVE